MKRRRREEGREGGRKREGGNFSVVLVCDLSFSFSHSYC